MKNINRILISSVTIAIIWALLTFFSLDQKTDRNEFITKPVLNNSEKWRIGCYVSGQNKNYPVFLRKFAGSLQEIGWLHELTLPVKSDKETTGSTKQIWEHLANNSNSEYLEFIEGAYWNADFDSELREKIKYDIITYLQLKKIDALITIGSWAGLDVANDEHTVPIVITCVDDPIKSKIIKRAEKPGYDHIHAKTPVKTDAMFHAKVMVTILNNTLLKSH